MSEHENLERLARIMDDADFAFANDLAALEDVDPAELASFLTQPDPDTDGIGHD